MASQNDIITSQRINFIIDWTKHIISYYMLIVLSYHFLQWHIIWYSHRQPVSWWRFTCIGCVDAWWKEMKRKRWANGWPMGGQWVACVFHQRAWATWSYLIGCILRVGPWVAVVPSYRVHRRNCTSPAIAQHTHATHTHALSFRIF